MAITNATVNWRKYIPLGGLGVEVINVTTSASGVYTDRFRSERITDLVAAFVFQQDAAAGLFENIWLNYLGNSTSIVLGDGTTTNNAGLHVWELGGGLANSARNAIILVFGN